MKLGKLVFGVGSISPGDLVPDLLAADVLRSVM